MKDNKLLKISIISTIIALTVCIIQEHRITRLREMTLITDTVTQIDFKYDTVYITKHIKDDKPIVKYKTITKTDTLYKDTIPHTLTLQQRQYNNTLYDQDDTLTYDAFITGYDMDKQNYPTLDSIKLSLRRSNVTEVQTITQTIKTRQRQNKWHIQPQITGGYDPINRQWGIIVGVGIGMEDITSWFTSE